MLELLISYKSPKVRTKETYVDYPQSNYKGKEVSVQHTVALISGLESLQVRYCYWYSRKNTNNTSAN